MKCALLGLARLHRGGAGHYDVSANNILYGEEFGTPLGPQDPKRGLAALADLGLLAPAAGARGPRVMLLNRAPEIVLHMLGRLARYTAAADVFGAGCVLADLLRLCARRARAAAGAPAVAGEGLATFGDLMDPALWDDDDAEAEPSAEAYFRVYYRIMGNPWAAPGTPAAAGAFDSVTLFSPSGALSLTFIPYGGTAQALRVPGAAPALLRRRSSRREARLTFRSAPPPAPKIRAGLNAGALPAARLQRAAPAPAWWSPRPTPLRR
jgi:hypothetical protein